MASRREKRLATARALKAARALKDAKLKKNEGFGSRNRSRRDKQLAMERGLANKLLEDQKKWDSNRSLKIKEAEKAAKVYLHSKNKVNSAKAEIALMEARNLGQRPRGNKRGGAFSLFDDEVFKNKVVVTAQKDGVKRGYIKLVRHTSMDTFRRSMTALAIVVAVVFTAGAAAGAMSGTAAGATTVATTTTSSTFLGMTAAEGLSAASTVYGIAQKAEQQKKAEKKFKQAKAEAVEVKAIQAEIDALDAVAVTQPQQHVKQSDAAKSVNVKKALAMGGAGLLTGGILGGIAGVVVSVFTD